ncbi:CsgG/HfaB family protein [Parerythrobacter jejuensis]|uniref:Penicillin-binding protein activator LpoB n=1 Tax=Parerythrobacter jejuensis TaxID=795812 RepID=A0A845ALQ0_9SPHN|nr:CsgG/HfaB family protein [Parerythrobacter jejuensis]MXP30347.1 penicillin-binding protein activator LpoB [Parerythrobacter jejuensis]MXP33107.1 penicillin-binding protein activator LpoB [Parerythrobacter jejuensis]
MPFTKTFLSLACVAAIFTSVPADAQSRSSGRKAQDQGVQEIPRCQQSLGTLAIDEAQSRWWVRYNLPNPEALIKVLVNESGCFNLVDRGRALRMRRGERDLADSGELQRGSNFGRGQVKAADYYMIPDLVGRNNRSGGGGIGGALAGALGSRVLGGVLGRVKVNKKEANVTLSLVNARTTEISRVTEGYARKSDVSFRGGGGGLFGGTLAAIGGSGYENTQIGQVIVLAYLQAYSDMVTQLGGLPQNPSATSSATVQATGYGITRDGFSRIKRGMTVEQVNAIIGFQGDEEGFAGSVSTYMWREGQGANSHIMGVFNDGKLTGKSKAGF